MLTLAIRVGEQYLSVDTDTPFDLGLDEPRVDMFLHTAQISASSAARWPAQWLTSSVYSVSKFPPAACLECTVFGFHKFTQRKEVISAVKVRLVDAHSRLLEGQHRLRLWGKSVVERSYEYVARST